MFIEPDVGDVWLTTDKVYKLARLDLTWRGNFLGCRYDVSPGPTRG